MKTTHRFSAITLGFFLALSFSTGAFAGNLSEAECLVLKQIIEKANAECNQGICTPSFGTPGQAPWLGLKDRTDTSEEEETLDGMTEEELERRIDQRVEAERREMEMEMEQRISNLRYEMREEQRIEEQSKYVEKLLKIYDDYGCNDRFKDLQEIIKEETGRDVHVGPEVHFFKSMPGTNPYMQNVPYRR